ncbi:hypothetical protein TraAM80_05755 [Trypanosoma rangeli]|uniref:Transcription factor Iwr1 domain-containing protein n=1 Tax=Trypanosoma rangeli TaxID=5698 RepID=A0A422NDN5_TRYRA|nr:uncharacterized protein TraAM80_05755 [Trypanosoma rangeli]RNF03595.1 hypothetical protein TraAM80_05755 [Trypanosoma rangeli]|eukprot:RNF03595.1 hypothetical protein TraAM80_05755 [Trypanosoma rangeli]
MQRTTELQGSVSPRPRDVYMRVRRLRSWDCASMGDTAPPRLRIRLENKEDVNSIVGGAGCDAASSTSASLGTEQTPCTLHFRFLPKVGVPVLSVQATRNTHDDVFPSPSLQMSVKRLWNLRGCMVMDCAAVEPKREFNSISTLETEETKVDGQDIAAEAAGEWSLYVLDKEVLEEEDELEAKKEEAAAIDDEFCFDDLTITRTEEGFGVDTSNLSLGIHRMHRKRFRDDESPEYNLSLGLCDAACGDRLDYEEAPSIYDMLREHGQDCFLMEENAGCDPGLYIYPDHRRDDEYDSNAADFSANEYPEEPSTSSDTTGRTDLEDEEDTMRRRNVRYGNAWYDEGYMEASLSSGWSSSVDNH